MAPTMCFASKAFGTRTSTSTASALSRNALASTALMRWTSLGDKTTTALAGLGRAARGAAGAEFVAAADTSARAGGPASGPADLEFEGPLGIARTPTTDPTIKTAMPINQKLALRRAGGLAFLFALLGLRALDLRLKIQLPSIVVRDVKPQTRLVWTAST